ncbi:hypothetical protein HA402_006294 [Bradysia odoriphaga]|nr:hypothetical protein HA402_006294 [Bradysia odoriphaga]
MAKLIKFVSSVLLIIVLLFISMPTNGYKSARMRYNQTAGGFDFDSVNVPDESEQPHGPIIEFETGEDLD